MKLLIASVLASVSLSLSAHALNSTTCQVIGYSTITHDLSDKANVSPNSIPKNVKAWINKQKSDSNVERVWQEGSTKNGKAVFLAKLKFYAIPLVLKCEWSNVTKEEVLARKQAQEAAIKAEQDRVETLRIEKEARELAAKREQEARDLKEAARLEAKIKYEEVQGEGMWTKDFDENFSKSYDEKLSSN